MNLLGENAKFVIDFIDCEYNFNNIKIIYWQNKIQVIDKFVKFLKEN